MARLGTRWRTVLVAVLAVALLAMPALVGFAAGKATTDAQTKPPEAVITADIAAQQSHDEAAYLACRAKHEVAPECQKIIATIKRNQPEADVMGDVVRAKLVGVKPLSEKLAAAITRLDVYKAVWPQVVTYYVAIDYQLKKESRWFYNGVNYRLYVLALEEGRWVIVEASMAPVNIIRDAGYGFNTPEEARAAGLERIRERTGKFLNLQGKVIEDLAATPEQLREEKGLAALSSRLLTSIHVLLRSGFTGSVWGGSRR
ncbi:hypothetical protein [Desulfofundulus thermocisternus]|uniref:hypothetical protein n=1 Tax=Desulfofundulus thermocisternus TaxID=42471 RepID=UPI0019F04A8E|nr:hypothetical protein [Desulfofundulus thermocisternus]MBE3586329.1 hypothetical protein [Thermoanaerobacter sp.]MCS5695728.1 hypothetical protein [Desulfofundulus thermocisternus]